MIPSIFKKILYTCSRPFIIANYIALVLTLSHQQISAAEFSFKGQVSSWIVTNPEEATQLGLRYIPDFLVGNYVGDYLIDTEISLNIYGTTQYYHKSGERDTDWNFDPYRLWLRFSAPKYEIRVGLQKINFGSAMLLRPLMWFDSIDPRDPLQLTDGVYGILGRYYFFNNANIWIWGLYGNHRNRGWEVFSSDKTKPEYGGRLQIPIFTGEIAITYHHREIDITNNPFEEMISTQSTLPENRIGLDGKWDVEIGLWFEGVLIHRDSKYEQVSYQRQTNIGADYTFDIGNGLSAIAEYFTLRISDKSFASGEGVSLSALSLNYPIGILDDLTGMIYYDWDNKNWYRFISWQRTYDNWQFYLMGFWNPDEYRLFQTSIENNLYSGKGLQLLVVFNH